MALKPCRECGQQVSSKARSCPHCGVQNPAKGVASQHLGCGSGCLLLLIAVVGIGVVSSLGDSGASSPPPSRPASPAAPASSIPAAHRDAINAWLTAWSESQAASVRETCRSEPGCNPDQYLPSARPQTSFGWDGASRIEPTADWAQGPRYHATANGRTALIYLRDGRVVSVYLMTDGGRRHLCREEECHL